jgi:3-hydroxyisobutyrate dehydrogenase
MQTLRGGSLTRSSQQGGSHARQAVRVLAMAAPPTAAPGATRVGFIGTGVMGNSMCGHLLAAGFRVSVYTRTHSKAESLIERGAFFAPSPRALAEASDVVLSIVGFPEDVRDVLLGDSGALAALAPGGVVIDCTTSSPALAREVAAAAAARGCHAVDAPVSGGDAGARAATLSIMCGGEPGAVAAVVPLLKCLGTPHLLGPPGAGQACKAANQITIATTSALHDAALQPCTF